jgi:aminopeptidase N
MEYPGLIYISSSRYESSANPNILLGTVLHETAHQWWYSAVGNDQVNETWLDEGFARYSETIFVQEASGLQQSKAYFMQFVQNKYDDAIKKKKIDKTIVKNLSQYNNWGNYGLDIYTKGAVVLNELRNKIGDEKFFIIMRKYYETYKLKNASIKDFIQISEQITGQNLDEFLNSWFY